MFKKWAIALAERAVATFCSTLAAALLIQTKTSTPIPWTDDLIGAGIAALLVVLLGVGGTFKGAGNAPSWSGTEVLAPPRKLRVFDYRTPSGLAPRTLSGLNSDETEPGKGGPDASRSL